MASMTRPIQPETAITRRSLDSLAVLNRKSLVSSFGLDDIDWSLAADRARPWTPEEFSTLAYLPAFALLTAAEQLRCNQLQALSICEQFIWLERQVTRPLARVLDGDDVPPPLSEAIGHFIREEEKHIEMFWRALERAEPAWYCARTPHLFRVSPLQQFGIDRVAAHPRLLVAWIWLIIFVEERTLYVARRYIETEKTSPQRIAPLLTALHRFHLRDEARHIQLDQHVLAWLYDPQPRWKKRLSARMFHYMMRCYVNPRHSARAILAQLAREFPRLRERIVPRLMAELEGVGRNREFHRTHFSREALPRTFALLAEYPEHDRLWTLFIAADKHMPGGRKP